MAKNPLFSTYRQGENRVTSSMLAVFERIDLSLLESLLGAASGESSLQMVTFTNQPPGQGASVPDGRISARFAYWFEVKTSPGAVRVKQLQEHLANLGVGGSSADERLFVITPDAGQPPAIDDVGDARVVWFSFAALSDAIKEALANPTGAVPDQAAFLLRELQALLREDGLLDRDDVVVVAARNAYPEYLQHAVYVCQPGRTFRTGLTHMGFYTQQAIQREIAEIVYHEDNVPFTTEEIARRREGSDHDRRIGELIEALLPAAGPRQYGEAFMIFLLSPHDDKRTVQLTDVIVNDTKTAAGRPWAWTLGQRYVSLAHLTRPGVKATSDLDRP